MKYTHIYNLILMCGMGLAGSLHTHAQLQYPGKPLGDYRQMKGADLVYLLPPVEPLRIQALMQDNRDGQKKSLHYAVNRPIQLSPHTHGAWEQVKGYRIWRVHIISPGAFSMGVIFNEYRLRGGAKVIIYDPDKDKIKGAYTPANNKSSGIFAVGHIPGEELIVELQVPDHMQDYGQLWIGSVSHAFLPVALNGSHKDGRFGRSQDCEIDISCPEGKNWMPENRSVVRIETPEEYCTGVMVNNTSYDGAPLLLTAEHCFPDRGFAASTVFVFNYESSSCFGGDGSVEMSLSGSEILAVADSIDFCLVKLFDPPPDTFSVFFAGWDLAGPHNQGTASIHHPQGDVKKISFDLQASSVPSKQEDVPPVLWDYFYQSLWWIKEWDTGSTEGGSSGSPLLNADKRVIGLLSGGRARCGDSIGYDREDDRIIYDKDHNIDDYYTNLGVAWDFYDDSASSLKPWLDPVNSGVNQLEGFYPSPKPPPVPTDSIRFSLRPNPVSGMLYVSASHSADITASFRVYDLKGVLLLEGKEKILYPFVINVGDLAPGIFLISIEAGEVREILKFVVAQ